MVTFFSSVNCLRFDRDKAKPKDLRSLLKGERIFNGQYFCSTKQTSYHDDRQSFSHGSRVTQGLRSACGIDQCDFFIAAGSLEPL